MGQVPAVAVACAAGHSPRRVDALLGACLAAASRVPVACSADAEVLSALGVAAVDPDEVGGRLADGGVALLAGVPGGDGLPALDGGVRRVVLGVSGDEAARAAAEAARAGGAEVALAVTGGGGAAMFDTEGQSLLYQLEGGALKRRRIRPADCGVPDNDASLLVASGAEASARALDGVAAGRGAGHNRPESIERAVHHAVVINAALIMLAAGASVSLQDGAEMVKADIAGGVMARTLAGLRG